MLKRFLWALTVALTVTLAANADTLLHSLGAGAAVGATDEVACYQGANPLVRCTMSAIKTFMSASPTLVTPNLGTPAAGVLTNTTGLPTTGLVNAAVTYVKMQLGAANGLLGVNSGAAPSEVALGAGVQINSGVLNLAGRTAVADANCGALTNANSLVAFTTVLTAARSCTLPAANTFRPGQHIKFADEGDTAVGTGANPAINGANTVTLNRAGSDKIAGATSFVMNISRCWVEFEVDGVANFTPVSNSCLVVPVTQGGTGLTALGAGVTTALGNNLSAAGGLTTTIASGAKALATSAISSAACTSPQTAAATNTATTDVVLASFNGDPTAVTGYVPLTSGMLAIIAYPTADTVNFKVCNNTSGSITPGAITLNWRVVR